MPTYHQKPTRSKYAREVRCEGCRSKYWVSPAFFARTKRHFCSRECVSYINHPPDRKANKSYADYLARSKSSTRKEIKDYLVGFAARITKAATTYGKPYEVSTLEIEKELNDAADFFEQLKNSFPNP